jgi:tetratricopeptide (TPR) repeat protein
VSPRLRVYLNVALAVIIAIGIVVGLTLRTRTNVTQPSPFPGKPPVPSGLSGPSGAAIEQAFRSWPNGSINAVQKLGLEYPNNAIVQYYRGVALLWAGYPNDAGAALTLAKRLGTNTIIQGRADNLLHPNYFEPPSGNPYPIFQPTEKNALLERGSLVQQEGHQESAETLFARAAKLDPNDPQAATAAAVGLFDESNIDPSISDLGMLTGRFPRSQIVRYYLGLLLAWTAQGGPAITQFEDTVKLGPTTVIGKAARSQLEAYAKQSGSSSG